MPTNSELHWIAFEGYQKIAAGTPSEVAIPVKNCLERGPMAPVLIFNRDSSHPIELDTRGTDTEVLARVNAVTEGHSVPAEVDASSELAGDESEVKRGPGRRKLGVIAREVTLLPRHWDWLNRQPGGASAALRRLVDRARAEGNHQEQLRTAQESAYRFMGALCGNLPDFEDATRALFASDASRFEAIVAAWPNDVAAHVSELAQRVFTATARPELTSVAE